MRHVQIKALHLIKKKKKPTFLSLEVAAGPKSWIEDYKPLRLILTLDPEGHFHSISVMPKFRKRKSTCYQHQAGEKSAAYENTYVSAHIYEVKGNKRRRRRVISQLENQDNLVVGCKFQVCLLGIYLE